MSVIDTDHLKEQLDRHGMVGLSDKKGHYAVAMKPDIFERLQRETPMTTPMAPTNEPRKPTRKERKERAKDRDREVKALEAKLRRARHMEHEANRQAKLRKKMRSPLAVHPRVGTTTVPARFTIR